MEEFERSHLTVSDLLKIKNFTFKLLIVRINGKLIQKSDYEIAPVTEGDDVQVLHMISGG